MHGIKFFWIFCCVVLCGINSILSLLLIYRYIGWSPELDNWWPATSKEFTFTNNSNKPLFTKFIDKRQKENVCCQLNMTVDEVLVATSMCNRALQHNRSTCKCGRLLICRVVVVTGLWDSQYHKSLAFLASVKTHLPYSPIMVFDVGLNLTNWNSLASLCNVLPMKLDVQKYPNHVKDSTIQAWKPIIINMTRELLPSRHYEILLLCDHTCLFRGHIRAKLHFLAHHPIIPGQFSNYTFVSSMHDDMKSYLGLNESRKHYSSIRVFLSVNGILWLNDETTNYVLAPWLDCALHKQCIAPSDVKDQRCDILSLYSADGTYGGCHKFSDAAYNGVLTREYGIKYIHRLSYMTLKGLGGVYEDFNNTPMQC